MFKWQSTYLYALVLSTRRKKKPRNTINSKFLKIRKRKRDVDEIYNDYHEKGAPKHDEDEQCGALIKCYACDIIFISEKAKEQHQKTKKHKRRVKMLTKETPYTYKDALKAAEITL
ncbi:zinc finger protein, putative [Hepatocystis sp. ex Piliocolobus tephrosceles]|nr:zinc finger protein, putative [Hepatocystis sp. ex Piliocolobus tephrosceles]